MPTSCLQIQHHRRFLFCIHAVVQNTNLLWSSVEFSPRIEFVDIGNRQCPFILDGWVSSENKEVVSGCPSFYGRPALWIVHYLEVGTLACLFMSIHWCTMSIHAYPYLSWCSYVHDLSYIYLDPVLSSTIYIYLLISTSPSVLLLSLVN